MNLRYSFFIALWISLWNGVLPVAAEESPDAMATEYIGALHLGMAKDAAFKYLAGKPKLGKLSMSEATEEWSQSAEFLHLGVSLTLVSEAKTSAQTIGGVWVTSPSTLSLKTGIHIGSSEAEIIAAYKENLMDTRADGGGVAVDFSEGSLRFEIKNGKVAGMGFNYYHDR